MTRRVVPSALSRRAFLSTTTGALAALGLGCDGETGLTPPTTTGGSSADVIVIGAGIAGLSVARNLRAEGVSVIVLEARDRVGGRIWTDRSLGAPADLGASWIHGVTGNPITELAAEFGVSTAVTDYEDVALYGPDGSPITEAAFGAAEAALADLRAAADAIAENASADLSLGDAYLQALEANPLAGDVETLVDWLLANDETAAGADLTELSAWHSGDDDGFGGDDHLFPGGYDQVIDGLKQNLDIRLSTVVSRVEHGGAPAKVTTDMGEFTAEAVVCTFPLGVLKRGSITFVPALPATKQGAIDRLGMGVLDKVVLAFDDAFWDVDYGFLGYVSETHGEFPTALNWRTYGTESVLMAFTAGSFAKALEAQTDAQVQDQLMAVLRTLYGTSIPAPTAMVRGTWWTDPFAYGSYSHIPVGATGADYDVMAEPASDRLYFAGEATIRAYPGTVHGGWLSGVREAERLLVL